MITDNMKPTPREEPSDAAIAPGGWPRDFPSDLFWKTHVPMTDAEADLCAARLWSESLADPASSPTPSNRRILDVGCGRGEIARAFGRLGASVIGIDNDARCIAEAVADVNPSDGNVAFLLEDADRAFDPPTGFEGGFDLAFCHYTGWGYGGAERLRGTFETVADLLVPGGSFVIETYDGSAAIDRFDAFLAYPKETPEGTWQVMCSGELTEPSCPGAIGRIDQEWLFVSPGGAMSEKHRVAFEPMTREAIVAIAACAGFEDPEARHGGSLSRSTPGTPRMHMRFGKPAKRPVKSELAESMRLAFLHRGDSTAVVDGSSLSGRDILDVAARIEAALRTIPRIDGPLCVALMVPRSWAWPAGIMAIRAADLCFVPIDPDMPDDRIRGILTRTRPLAVLTTSDLKDRLDGIAITAGSMRVLPPGPGFESLEVVAMCDPEAMPREASHMVFTSGSTGMPKGVMLHERGLLKVVDAQIELLPPPPGSSMWMLNPSFDASLSDVLCAILGGRVLHVHRPAATRIKELKEALRRVQVVDMPPSMLNLVGEAADGLEALVFGGERAKASDVRRLVGRRYGFQAYGPTEASICAMVAFPTSDWTPGVLGIPLIEGTVALRNATGRTMVVTADATKGPNGVLLEGGDSNIVEGEIVIAGPIVAHGYFHDDDMEDRRFGWTEAFGGDPEHVHRLHMTGDLARFEDGLLVWTGRTDRQIKINGRMVCPEEIEAVVEDLSPMHRAKVVTLQGRTVLFLTGGAAPCPNLANRIAATLGEQFKPSRIIDVGTFPTTPNGKVDEKVLKEMVDA
jgi:acyl-CoA synthetase (AMP-forming)/AMP-acid ligase II/SAM-dependent methyltransferase